MTLEAQYKTAPLLQLLRLFVLNKRPRLSKAVFN